jgi:hypothetical protein
MTSSWHPDLRKLLAATDPTTVFSINIKTSVPLEAWEPGLVTCIGDAIHTMTPGRGVGANTALRDALALVKRLKGLVGGAGQHGSTKAPGAGDTSAAAAGGAGDAAAATSIGATASAAASSKPSGRAAGAADTAAAAWTSSDLVKVVGDYEQAMRQYAYTAVQDSRRAMDESNLMYHPWLGWPVLVLSRFMWRLFGALPLWLQYRILFGQLYRGRGHKEHEDWLAT